MSNSETPWTAALQASLSFTISWSLLKLMSIELVMPSNQLICCYPLSSPQVAELGASSVCLIPKFFIFLLHIRFPFISTWLTSFLRFLGSDVLEALLSFPYSPHVTHWEIPLDLPVQSVQNPSMSPPPCCHVGPRTTNFHLDSG